MVPHHVPRVRVCQVRKVMIAVMVLVGHGRWAGHDKVLTTWDDVQARESTVTRDPPSPSLRPLSLSLALALSLTPHPCPRLTLAPPLTLTLVTLTLTGEAE